MAISKALQSQRVYRSTKPRTWLAAALMGGMLATLNWLIFVTPI